jgi:hypothetical protein
MILYYLIPLMIMPNVPKLVNAIDGQANVNVLKALKEVPVIE